ncbi:tRNA modification GTPase trmE [gamma proteobacterium HIMB55]|nr:tRNA modification GTPase trmE [gamma proteobacterium HIMB55]
MAGLDTDTIAAVATARGNGPVGIIRLSGPGALTIAQAITGSELKARFAHYASFTDSTGSTLDTGIALYFPGPNSFTGEDVVELQGHGGHIVLQTILNRCLNLGARSARPGEFSERAFLNGKIDLLQAEAIADLISAESETAAKLASTSLSGSFSNYVNTLSERLNELRALTEASIDFPEEDIDILERHSVIQRLEECKETLSALLDEVSQSQRKTQTYTAVLYGAPNAGKSSLLNALAHDDVAIVTHLAGTTRDTLKQNINIGELTLEIIDTAGIRETQDVIEQEGVKRAKDSASLADLVIHVIDDAAKTADASQIEYQTEGNLVLRVRNKIDQSGRSAGHSVSSGNITEVGVSAKTGEGLSTLTETIETLLLGDGHQNSQFSARQRHVEALADANKKLKDALAAFNLHNAAELLSEDLKLVQSSIDSLTGKVSSDDILGKIFSSFCIGK